MSLKCTILAFIEQFATALIAASGKPTYAAGRGGSCPDGTWLLDNNVPTNKTGIPFGLNNGQLVNLWVGSDDLKTYDLLVYYHQGDEVGLTLLTTVTVSNASRTATFDVSDFGIVNVPTDIQIAYKVDNNVGGAPSNVKVHATIKGTT